jgi:hypothetical protein
MHMTHSIYEFTTAVHMKVRLKVKFRQKVIIIACKYWSNVTREEQRSFRRLLGWLME